RRPDALARPGPAGHPGVLLPARHDEEPGAPAGHPLLGRDASRAVAPAPPPRPAVGQRRCNRAGDPGRGALRLIRGIGGTAPIRALTVAGSRPTTVRTCCP